MTSHHNQGDKWLSAENKTASILKWCPEYSNNSFAIPKGKGSRKTLEQLMLPERKDENTFETFPKDPLVTRSVDEKLSKIEEEEEDGVCLPEKPKRMLVVWLPKVSMLAQHCQVPGHSFYKETGKNIKSLDRNEREELTALPCIRYHHRSPVHFMEGFVRKPAKFADQPEKGEPQSRATTSEDNLPRVSTRQVCSTQKHANKNFLHSKPTCSNSLVESLKKKLIERPVENALQKELAKRAKNNFDPARLVRTNDSQVTHITLNNSIMEPTVSQAISLQYDHYTWSPPKSVHVYSENYSNCHLGNSKSLLKRRKKCQDPCLNASVHRRAKQSLQHHPLLFSLIPTKPVPFPFSLFQPFPFRNAQEINRFNGISKEL